MKFRNGLMTAVAGTFLLSGCANWDVDKAALLPNQGDEFAAALHEQYIDRARFEVKEEDWFSVDFFTERAKIAANGSPLAPQDPAERHLQVDIEEIQASHSKLTTALANGAAKMNPMSCAKSQAWLEHWMEQSEEGHQEDDIAEAREAFKSVIDVCASEFVAESPAPTFKIYFPFSSSKLTAEAKSMIHTIVAFFSDKKPASVNLAGHTDTVGSDSSNMKLGMKRVNAVAKVLGKHGVSPITEKSYGETHLPVPTKDGVKNQENRQVTVTFK